MPPHENLNDHERALVETIVNYDVVAERCAAKLRQYDRILVDRLWAEGQGIFTGDPAKYPVVMASQHDIDGRNRFRMKCQELCFESFPNKPTASPTRVCISCFHPFLFNNTVSQLYYDVFWRCSWYAGRLPGCGRVSSPAGSLSHRTGSIVGGIQNSN
jgi:hypothetical protein